MSSFSASDIPDLTGKVVIVTGGNTGLGFATARQLVAKNAKVYIASRSLPKAQAAISTIHAENPTARVEFLHLDLTDLKQVREAAEAFVKTGERLDILVNNAGIGAVQFELTKDGYESHFATNHLGHFLFTTILLPVIERSAPSRIVIVSSDGHSSAPPEGILFDSINDKSALGSFNRYGQSKLANILFTKSLAERLEGKDVLVNAVHPGVSNINPADNSWANWFALVAGKFLAPYIANSPETGALTQLYVATSPEIREKNYRGQYFVPITKLGSPSKQAQDKALRDKLWTFSEAAVNKALQN
ncbi:hypothetical protein HK096_010372 [Nowakowskiella sp. JEL0078]|nr:hypothetical protein HK096_010372 [Nowakowskiella sp. JEL0078]